jgi:hypothetical protein
MDWFDWTDSFPNRCSYDEPDPNLTTVSPRAHMACNYSEAGGV